MAIAIKAIPTLYGEDAILFQIREDALQRVLLAETHVSIAIAVLYAHDEVTYDCHAGTVARELLHRTSPSL